VIAIARVTNDYEFMAYMHGRKILPIDGVLRASISEGKEGFLK
jgi:hypothetical protein